MPNSSEEARVNDIIHVIKAGKLEDGGKKLRLGEMVLAPVDPANPDGPKKTAVKFGRTCLKLGNGLTAVGEVNGTVALEVTAEAARRLGWEHPANEAKKADVNKLTRIVGNQSCGQEEQKRAIREIETVDPALAARLIAANQWLFS